MSKKTEIIYYRESFIQSLLSDIATFSLLVGSFAFNELFVGSGFLNGILLVMFIFYLLGKGTVKKTVFYNAEDLVDHLCDEFPDEICRKKETEAA